jgi:hypothetical protein
MPNKYYPSDARLEHRAPASAAVTATATVDTISQRVAQRTEYLTQVNIEAIKISANNEAYNFVVEVSNDSFTTVHVAASYDFGPTETRLGGAPDSVAGDFNEFPWCSEVEGTVFKDARIRVIIAGTSPSITFACRTTIC